MDRAAFAQLVRDMIEAMGQHLEAARPIEEGMALRTADRYLYVFVSESKRSSAPAVGRWCAEADTLPDHLVVFALEPLSADLGDAVRSGGGRLIEGPDFRRLVDELGITTPLIEHDPSIHRPVGSALPSAREMDADMVRAQTWYAAGVLPLAARFYTAAVRLKPEYVDAWSGLARTETALSQWAEAERAWERVLSLEPASTEARLGLAGIAGARGNIAEEVAMYLAVLHDHPSHLPTRISLVAALIDRKEWGPACREVEQAIPAAPADPRLRWLHALLIDRSNGDRARAEAERSEARRLGLTTEDELELSRSVAAESTVPADPR